jgi:hypothetical protein
VFARRSRPPRVYGPVEQKVDNLFRLVEGLYALVEQQHQELSLVTQRTDQLAAAYNALAAVAPAAVDFIRAKVKELDETNQAVDVVTAGINEHVAQLKAVTEPQG